MSTSTPLLSRMQNPIIALDGALEAAQALSKAASRARVPIDLEFLSLRASQINGCSWCVDMHAKALRKAGESEERVYGIGAWRELPYYSDAERAALALTEAVTRMADQSDPVPDAVYDAAAEHFDEQQLAAIILAIATINLWNRVNVTTRQVVSAA
jgi:AhpD family alkylhydroperoxidase